MELTDTLPRPVTTPFKYLLCTTHFNMKVTAMVGVGVVLLLHTAGREWWGLSQACNSVWLCRGRLTPSPTFPGAFIDLTDTQWRHLRESLPLLAVVAVLCTALNAALSRSAAVPRRAMFGAQSLVFLAVVHGLHAVQPVALAVAVFFIMKACILCGRSAAGVAVVWLIVLSLLVVNEFREGWLDLGWLGAVGRAVDASPQMYSWRAAVNLVCLRLLSFAYDWHWASVGGSATPPTAPNPTGTTFSYGTAVKEHRPLPEYNLPNMLLYVFYMPLYIAGPVATFNAFAAQLAAPLARPSPGFLMWYALRLVFAAVLLEVGLHWFPVFAIIKSRAFSRWAPSTVASFAYMALTIMWLKFLVLWRFFRLWALCDGVEAPENMERCMSNNYTLSGFWRCWHSSFHQWLVRYIYFPLGGSRKGVVRQVLHTVIVFTFVAMWHDMNASLFTWGWLFGVFFVPEIAATRATAAFTERWWYRCVVGLGGAANIMILMVANLVGYAVGTDGIVVLLRQLFMSWEGAKLLLGAYGLLFLGVEVMLEVRDCETRQCGPCRGRRVSDRRNKQVKVE